MKIVANYSALVSLSYKVHAYGVNTIPLTCLISIFINIDKNIRNKIKIAENIWLPIKLLILSAAYFPKVANLELN